MRYIANIITKNKIEISSFFNVTSDFSAVDTNIPTLIIGWSEVRELFPNQDILNPEISSTISWTFSKREKRYQYEKDIESFINKVLKGVDENINYRFFNYALATPIKRENFVKYVQSGHCSIYYNSRFLYVYNIHDSFTIGISLIDLAYIGINIKQFITSLTLNNNNIICENMKCIDSDSYTLIKDNIKIIAYLNYLRNYDIYKEKVNNG